LERADIESVNHQAEITGQQIEVSSHDTIAHHAKSFYWASKFLRPGVFKDVSFLYMFCRWVDDTADELSPDQARKALTQIKSQILGVTPPNGIMVPFLRLCLDKGVKLEWVIELLNGAESDLLEVKVADEKELLVYSYRVAGVVGLMMCPLIGVKNPEAHYHAIDLGLAMQLTNIARDVAEDALIDRVYLPSAWLNKIGITSAQLIEIASGRANEERERLNHLLRPVIKDLLDLSDLYTESGIKGLGYIPPRERLSILVAARIYQAIGKKIRKHNYLVMGQRTRVSSFKKALITIRCLFEFIKPSVWKKPRVARHEESLHWGLRGLPAVHKS
jgi:phytoene synthase